MLDNKNNDLNSMILRMKDISRKDLDRTEKYHRAYFILAAHLEK